MQVHLPSGDGAHRSLASRIEQRRNARVVSISRNAGVVEADEHLGIDMIITLPYTSFAPRSLCAFGRCPYLGEGYFW